MVDFVLGLGLALPITAASGISVTTGVAQGVSEQKKHNADASNQLRMLKFHLDSQSEGPLNGYIVTVHNGKVWLEQQNSEGQPKSPNHPFTGFFLAYPDPERPVTRGLVSTISRDPPMLNWIYIEKDTFEAKYASRSGSIAHHVGDYDWTTDSNEDSHITFQQWEGFIAVEESNDCWALYFDLNDDGLAKQRHGRRTCEVSLVRRVITAQEVNKWGLSGDGNIGFKATKEIDKLSAQRKEGIQ